MPLNIVFWRPQNRSRLKPYYQNTITAVKEFLKPRNSDCISNLGRVAFTGQLVVFADSLPADKNSRGAKSLPIAKNQVVSTGPNFIHPPPPNPENTLEPCRGGGKKGGGVYKILLGGGFNITPPPSP